MRKSTDARISREGFICQAGATFHRTGIFRVLHSCITFSVVSCGISFWTRLIFVSSSGYSGITMSLVVNLKLAPGATAIRFLPLSSTMIWAMPEWILAFTMIFCIETPELSRLFICSLPRESSPTQPTISTAAPALAAATAWVATLPPGNDRNLPPVIVSPGDGREST